MFRVKLILAVCIISTFTLSPLTLHAQYNGCFGYTNDSEQVSCQNDPNCKGGTGQYDYPIDNGGNDNYAFYGGYLSCTGTSPQYNGACAVAEATQSAVQGVASCGTCPDVCNTLCANYDYNSCHGCTSSVSFPPATRDLPGIQLGRLPATHAVTGITSSNEQHAINIEQTLSTMQGIRRAPAGSDLRLLPHTPLYRPDYSLLQPNRVSTRLHVRRYSKHVNGF